MANRKYGHTGHILKKYFIKNAAYRLHFGEGGVIACIIIFYIVCYLFLFVILCLNSFVE